MRTGIIIMDLTIDRLFRKPSNIEAVIEVQEIRTIDDITKIKVIKISGIEEIWKDDVKEIIPDWVKTSAIKWLD